MKTWQHQEKVDQFVGDHKCFSCCVHFDNACVSKMRNQDSDKYFCVDCFQDTGGVIGIVFPSNVVDVK